MNRKIIYMLMITLTIITALSVFYILSGYGDVRDVDGITQVEAGKSNEEKVAEKNNKSSSVADRDSSEIEKQNDKEKDSKGDKNESIDKDLDKKSVGTEELKKREESSKNQEKVASANDDNDIWQESNDSKSSNSNKDEDKVKPVFKVNAENIVSSMSLDDKVELAFIGSKLSTIDEGRVKEYLYDKNREEGVRKAYKLLKERLSDEDFDKVKGILASYINLDAIEQ